MISDTHLESPDDRFLEIYEKNLKDCDLLLHAGDITGIEMLSFLNGEKFESVAGNMDGSDIRASLPGKLTVKANGASIGLIHGWGTPWGIEDRLLKEFQNVDCIVYGHTHAPRNSSKNGILMFNPGTLLDRRFSDVNTFGILRVEKELTGEIVRV